jgi:hypothetical protein
MHPWTFTLEVTRIEAATSTSIDSRPRADCGPAPVGLSVGGSRSRR